MFIIISNRYTKATTALAILGLLMYLIKHIVHHYRSKPIEFTIEIKTYPGYISTYSPVLAQFGMGLIYTAANGETSDQLRTAFDLPENKTLLMELAIDMKTPKYNNDFQVDIVTGLFYKRGLNISQEFVENAREYFGAEVKAVDFTKKMDAFFAINRYVMDKSQKHIHMFVLMNELNENANSAVVISALYFKARWEHAFSEANTTSVDFYETPKDKAAVLMMSTTNRFGYLDMPEYAAKIVNLPYKDSDVSMMIILPYELDGLDAVIKNFEEYDVRSLLMELKEETVKVQLPKFKLQPEVYTKEFLKKSNYNALFSNNSDLSEIFVNQTVGITDIISKLYFDVDEAGSRSSATPISTDKSTENATLPLQQNVKDFKVDRPFMFVVLTPFNVLFMSFVEQMRSTNYLDLDEALDNWSDNLFKYKI